MKPGKSCSSLKKRCIKFSGGKVMAGAGYKRHRMLRKNSRMRSQSVGCSVRSAQESILLKRVMGKTT